jgi:hypothetical protein
MVEAIYEKGKLVRNRRRLAPSLARIVREARKDISISGSVQIHPGTIQASVMCTARQVARARGIDQGSAERFGRDHRLKGKLFGINYALVPPSKELLNAMVCALKSLHATYNSPSGQVEGIAPMLVIKNFIRKLLTARTLMAGQGE